MVNSKLPITNYQLPNYPITQLPSFRFILALLLLFLATPLYAQDEAPPPVERLTVTGTSAESLPDIEVRVYGRDAQGNPLDLSRETLAIEHGGEAAGLINYQGAHRTGTLTIFLIDIPTGVQAELPALQEAINQYAGPGNMMEQVDYAAVYQVGASQARELLAPTNFHNSVRNLFADPLTPETGATALYDSTLDLLGRAASLAPNADMPIHLVLITDGTDAVSSNSGTAVSQRAAELGIPVHTIWLENTDIGDGSVGQNYLAGLAAASGGVAMQLNNAADLPLIWNRIAGFRDQARIRYQVNNLSGGTFPVAVSLANQPGVRDETEVNIPANIPSVVIDLPPEARTLSLSNVEEPVRLRFKTAVSWLDGQERTVEAAQLVVNGNTAAPYEIPVDSLDEFVADVANLNFGNNTVEVVVLDDQGMRATSPTVILTVEEGRRNIPSELSGGNQFVQFASQLLTFLLVLAVLGGILFFVWQRGYLSRSGGLRPGGGEGRRGRRRGGPSVTVTDAGPIAQPTGVIAYLDVLEAVSRMATPIPLQGTVVRLGRSPAQCEIAFENDITVSRQHANLQLEGSDYRIFDDNSTSGTFVNERQVPEYGVQLVDGDEIHLGAVHLRYRRV
jgi:hypothetical protein